MITKASNFNKKLCGKKKSGKRAGTLFMARLLPHKKGWVGWGKIRGELKFALN
jgi:hypothetical protein